MQSTVGIGQTSVAPCLHFWTPGLFDFKGGIQVFSQFLLQNLQALYPQIQYDVFSMHDRDPASQRDRYLPQTKFWGQGQIPIRLRTPTFAAQIVSMGLWQRPNLVLTTHLNFTVAAHRLKQLAGVPYWTMAHGFEAWEIDRPQVRQALTNADRILAVSHYTRDRMLAGLEIDPDRIHVLPNTFGAERFQVAEKPAALLEHHGLRRDQPVILTVNRLAAGESFHSYDQILAALPQIRSAIPDVHYLIVGGGNDRQRLEKLIRAQNLQDCVTLAGFIPDEELPAYYNLCDVFAMPSKLEGFGIVYLEAMASGKPVVGGQDGAIDALDRGRLGAIVNPDDVAEIATTLTQILQQQYPNPLLYQPPALREAVVQTFGPLGFQQRLSTLMADSPLLQPLLIPSNSFS
ncbi:glycosyltransferase [Alkalinema sp. FACHB-956]|uniref:glycosyltransferase n=1 Tax=Alkalinema sp. FACHB-956 TaxID=2692768 RepID=UPI001688EF66|nr:glycosyltransferase [Alkalinema sp. FACHB-956]MBD2325335.1 glycosyltransferase [Alkalinema sp. FACHB-956]